MGKPRTDGDSPNNLKSFPRPSPDLLPILERPYPINHWFRGVFLSHQLQSYTKQSHVEEQLECNEYRAALWPLSLRQAKRRGGRSFLKREEVWGSTFSIWRGVLGNDIF